MYPQNYGEAFDKRSTKKFKFVFGDDVNVAIDGFPVERERAELYITDRSESLTGNGTTGRLIAVEQGQLTDYKCLRAADRLKSVATQ